MIFCTKYFNTKYLDCSIKEVLTSQSAWHPSSVAKATRVFLRDDESTTKSILTVNTKIVQLLLVKNVTYTSLNWLNF